MLLLSLLKIYQCVSFYQFQMGHLAVAVLLLLGPTVLKSINQARDEKRSSLVQNPMSIEIEDLQAANNAIEGVILLLRTPSMSTEKPKTESD